MSDAHITVQFERPETGFTTGKSYDVLVIESGRLLMIDDDARMVWVDVGKPTPVSVLRGGQPLFDLEIHRFKRRIERLLGKPVVLTTWENLGFEPDDINSESMLIYHGVAESYDGETLFLKRVIDGEESRFGVLPKAIARIDEETGSSGGAA